MAKEVNRGEIWLYTFDAPDKRRPVIVISRQVLLDVTHSAIVVPITSQRRGAPTEVDLGIEDGLKGASCANAANIQTVSKARLTRYVGSVRREKLNQLCEALAIASGCAD
ncbi:MAG: PemK-like protein [Myxococcales bacterium]|nr:PemK-like protein [Myxococcales bacterium]